MTQRRTTHTLFRRPIAIIAAVALTALAATGPADANTTAASEQINAGSLEFINSTPANIAFPAATLDGTDQTVTEMQAFDVSDATGTGAGWNITATSTTFTAGSHTLPSTATTIQSAPTLACDSGSTCVPADNTVSYPYSLPAGTTAPTATTMVEATTGTGMGNETITPTWSLTVPATAWAGGSGTPYQSTWTFTLVAGP
jgi:hypothetical protein